MPNNYYNVSTTFIPGTKVRSDQVNIEYQALEAAFDLLPTDTASLILNTATYFGGTGGIGNDYVLNPSPARTSLTDGEEIVFIADRANTGAATMQINALSPVPIVRFDGQPLPAGDIQDGLFHVARYDSFNARFQMVSPALSAISSATDAALSAAAAQAWAINAEDVPVPIIYGGDGVSTFSSFHWAQKALAVPTLQRINTDIVTATPPTTEAVTGLLQYYDADDTDLLAYVGFNGSNLFNIYNQMRGGQVQLAATDAAGAGRFGFVQDPDGATSVWGDTSISLLVNSSTRYQFVEAQDTHEFYQTTSPAITSAQPFNLSFRMDDSTEIGALGWNGSSQLILRNRVHGGGIELRVENASGSDAPVFRADDGSSTDLYVPDEANIPLLRIDTGFVRIQSPTATRTDNLYLEGYDNGAGLAWIYGRENGSNSLFMRNVDNSGLVRIQGTSSGAATQDILQADPDGETQIFYNGVKTIATRADGQLGVYAAGSVSASFDSEVRFKASTGGDWGWVGQVGGQFEVAANLTSAGVTLRGKNSTNTMENLFVGDPDGAVTLYHDGAIKAETFGSGWQIRDDANSGAGGAHSVRFTLASSDGTNRARLGFATQAALSLRNINQGGNVVIDAEDATNVIQDLFIGNPDGAVDLYYDGTKRAGTGASGDLNIYSDGNTDGEGRFLTFRHQNATARARVGFAALDSTFYVRNLVHGAVVTIDGEDAGGTVRTILTADPDGLTTLRANSNLQLQCNGGETALIGNSNADVALYWNNVESFRTQDPNANTKTTAAEVLHADGSFYNIGMNISAPKTENTSFSAASTWQDYAGHSILKTTTATPTYTTPGSTDAVIPNGSVWNIHNIGSSGNITIAAGSGVTLTWQDGAGGTTGNRTIAPGGSATLWKRLDTEFYIYGTGIA